MPDISTLLRVTIIGLQLGMTFAIITVGLTLIFGLLDVINFAHGAFFMLGAYLAVTISGLTGNFWVALGAAVILTGIIGALSEVLLLRRLYGRDPLFHVLLTFGLAIAIEELVLNIWGADPKNIQAPSIVTGTVDLGLMVYPVYQLFVFFLSAIVIVLLWITLTRTRAGTIVTTVADDSEMVDALGINSSKVSTGVFGISTALAALAGILLGTDGTVSLGMGTDILIDAFAIVVVGGLGNFSGTVVASILFGLVTAFSSLYIPAMTDMIIYLFVAVMLLINPEGLNKVFN